MHLFSINMIACLEFYINFVICSSPLEVQFSERPVSIITVTVSYIRLHNQVYTKSNMGLVPLYWMILGFNYYRNILQDHWRSLHSQFTIFQFREQNTNHSNNKYIIDLYYSSFLKCYGVHCRFLHAILRPSAMASSTYWTRVTSCIRLHSSVECTNTNGSSILTIWICNFPRP